MQKRAAQPMKSELNIVWLKRDFRTQDHEPLHEAEKSGTPYLIIYLFEPSLMAHPDNSFRHWSFIYHSILMMNESLAEYNRSIAVAHADAVEVFQFLLQNFKVKKVFSYQESGVQVTWDRDRAVRRLLEESQVTWKEFQRDGIIRGIRDRKDWDKHWFHTMSKPAIQNKFSWSLLEPLDHPFPIPSALLAKLTEVNPSQQQAGEKMAWRYLKSFVEERGFYYQKHISKPTESRHSCARISPYLSWGNISIKQAYQTVRFHPNYARGKRAFNAFLSRLKWHCHFIQKFEVENRYETHCINTGYELLERNKNTEFIQAWEKGQTGFPLVDACMRCVCATGWINFRMRAMVVSFFCHHLDQDWKDGVYHLAKQFLDYEPGIHYPQFQMQAGTTGVNTVRMYNPVKQSQDHDPEGLFIKKWVPELHSVPVSQIHEPWKMTEIDQVLSGIKLGEDYPWPLVDLEISGRQAREKIWGHRKNQTVKKEKQRILATHVRPNQK